MSIVASESLLVFSCKHARMTHCSLRAANERHAVAIDVWTTKGLKASLV
jgi:hypothetical protein